MYWNNVIINTFTASLVRMMYEPVVIEQKEFDSLRALGKRCEVKEISLYVDTLRVLYDIRRALHNQLTHKQVKKEIDEYSKKYNLLNFHLSTYGFSIYMDGNVLGHISKKTCIPAR
jgi:hypothetical protein